MFYDDPYSIERTMNMRVKQEFRQAEASRLGKLAGSRSESLSLRGRQLVSRLALRLVAVGGRLVRYGLPAYEAQEGAVSSSPTVSSA
jgi:hypothetical protein